MKIKIRYLDNKIELNEGNIPVIEVENKKYFYRLVNDFWRIYNSNIIEDIIFLNDENQEINCCNKIKVILNYFDLGFESKKYMNDIFKYINENISDEDRNSLNTQYSRMIKMYRKTLNHFDISLSVESELDIDNLTKIMKVRINSNNELLNNLLLIIDLERELKSNKLLIFINLKQYLKKEELKELYKYSIYNQVKILLIDSQSYGGTLNNENKLIIDENLDEFMI